MTGYTILIAADLTAEGLRVLHEDPQVMLDIMAPNSPTLREKIKTAHAIISRDDVTIDAGLLDIAKNLRVIGRLGTNVAGVDLDAATKRGIIVTHTPGANAVAAAEHTLTLMLALNRRLIQAHTSVRDGYWLHDRKRNLGTQLRDKTLGLVGYGRVGRLVANLALAFGMQVIAYDPYVGESQRDNDRVTLVGLRDLVSRADIVSLHIPPTRETHGLFNETVIRQMKPGAKLINTSHGSIVDERALADALRDEYLAGAAVDVFAEEPPHNSPLVGLECVIHTPHIGDHTVEAQQDVSLLIATQVLDALRGEDYRNVVNMPFVHGVDYERIYPYLQLAESLGILQQMLAQHPINRVAVEYRGEDMAGLVKPLTVALLRGMLKPVLGEKVNYINAPVLAQERGIQVTRTKGLKTGDYASLVSCEVTWENGSTVVMAGTLLDQREPHIVQMDQYRMNFVPRGIMLFMGSYDQPGVIGRVGTFMAENNVNIASWQTGRAEPGGHTLTVMTLDAPITDGQLEDLRQQNFVRHAVQVQIQASGTEKDDE
ncbi:MAG: phosphoglycerate dehydrogenase [Anaerolineae bacterium]|nr:phosphoglycerate dehydrogenase [Anaerolineae bacterium]